MATITSNFGKREVPDTVSSVVSATNYGRWGKRLFDIAASLAGLVISSPLLLLSALLVRVTSRGPILFRQIRIGHLGRPFTLIKFRTMLQGSESQGSSVVVVRDPRLTPVGSFLRRTKLDEFPQFFNVLLGHMSFVGPRPRVPSEIDSNDPREQILQSVRPGVTSYASIHHRMEADYCARHPNPQAVFHTSILPQKRNLDCEYVRNLNFRLDMKLLLLTVVLLCLPGKSLEQGIRIFGWKVKPYSREGQMFLDLAAYMVAAWLAYTFRYDSGFLPFYRYQMWMYILFIPLLRVLVNRAFEIYDMMWRYVTLEDASHLAASLAPVSVILFTFRIGHSTILGRAPMLLVPLSIITLEYLLAFSASLTMRFSRRVLYTLQHHYQPLPAEARRVMILGAGLMGLMTAQDIRQYPHMNLVGFLDDDPAKERRLMAGSRVLGNTDHLESLCARHHVTDLMICAKSIDPQRMLDLLRRCEGLRVKVHNLPGLDRVLHDESEQALPDAWGSPFATHPR